VYICLYNRLRLVVFVFARLEVVVVVGECCDTIDSKLDPDREDSILPFPSPPPASRLVRNPMKKEALEPTYEPVLMSIFPLSMGMQNQK